MPCEEVRNKNSPICEISEVSGVYYPETSGSVDRPPEGGRPPEPHIGKWVFDLWFGEFLGVVRAEIERQDWQRPAMFGEVRERSEPSVRHAW